MTANDKKTGRWGGPTVPPISEGHFPTFGRGKKPEWLQFYTRYGDAAMSNATINTKTWTRDTVRNSAHMDDGCRQQFCIQNRGQVAADRDKCYLTVYRNSEHVIPSI